MNGKVKLTYERYWHKRIKKSMEEKRGNKPPNEIFATASSALRGGREKVLDVGCGDGYFALYIKDKSRRSYGAEIAEEAAHLASVQCERPLQQFLPHMTSWIYL